MSTSLKVTMTLMREQYEDATFEKNRTRNRRIAALVAMLFLAVSLAFPGIAQADVRKADVIMGDTVDARGLSVVDCPDVVGDYAFVMDEAGTVYFERDADAEVPIASITKVMTAVVALDSAPLDTTITVSEAAAAIGESSAELQAGDSMPLSQALVALMVPSGNDAAQAIAESVGALLLQNQGLDATDPDTCCQAFVDAMNAKAQELGMTHTVYRNPHGLDDGEFTGDQHSSARDVATLAAYAMKKQEIRDVTASDTAICTVSREGKSVGIELTSTDELLNVYEGACGIKTGYTDGAGACFAGACNRGDGDLYSVVLHAPDEWTRFADTQNLWDWVYDNRVTYPLTNSTQTTVDERNGETVPLVAEVAAGAWINKTVDATLANPNATATVFALSGNVSQSVEYKDLRKNVKAGDVVGTITYKQHNEVIATMDMVATETVAAPNVFQGIGIWWNRLLSGISGSQKVADSVFYNDSMIINDKSGSNQ